VFSQQIVLEPNVSLEFVPQLDAPMYQNALLVLMDVLLFNVMKLLVLVKEMLSLVVNPLTLVSFQHVKPSMDSKLVLLNLSVLNQPIQSVLQSSVKLMSTTNQLVSLNHQIVVLTLLVVDLLDVMPLKEVVMLSLKMVSVNNSPLV
jgi:hypothetical protein